MERMRKLLELNLPATIRLRRHGGRVRVFRRTQVRVNGRLDVAGSLSIGSQWSTNHLYLPGQLHIGQAGQMLV
jgi:hypothetical protein